MSVHAHLYVELPCGEVLLGTYVHLGHPNDILAALQAMHFAAVRAGVEAARRFGGIRCLHPDTGFEVFKDVAPMGRQDDLKKSCQAEQYVYVKCPDGSVDVVVAGIRCKVPNIQPPKKARWVKIVRIFKYELDDTEPAMLDTAAYEKVLEETGLSEEQLDQFGIGIFEEDPTTKPE